MNNAKCIIHNGKHNSGLSFLRKQESQYLACMGYVYIVSNKHRTVLYTGVTNNIERRICEHKAGVGSAFASKFKCNELLYYEQHMTMAESIQREKHIKKWKRDWKIDLIKLDNPNMLDLAIDWFTVEQLNAAIQEYKLRKKEIEA